MTLKYIKAYTEKASLCKHSRFSYDQNRSNERRADELRGQRTTGFSLGGVFRLPHFTWTQYFRCGSPPFLGSLSSPTTALRATHNFRVTGDAVPREDGGNRSLQTSPLATKDLHANEQRGRSTPWGPPFTPDSHAQTHARSKAELRGPARVALTAAEEALP